MTQAEESVLPNYRLPFTFLARLPFSLCPIGARLGRDRFRIQISSRKNNSNAQTLRSKLAVQRGRRRYSSGRFHSATQTFRNQLHGLHDLRFTDERDLVDKSTKYGERAWREGGAQPISDGGGHARGLDVSGGQGPHRVVGICRLTANHGNLRAQRFRSDGGA